jgi:signal transduction histidine kinase
VPNRPAHRRLVQYLGARLGPLAILVVIVTCVSAPLAFFVLGRRALGVRAEATAQQVAAVIQQDAAERTRLWKYDSPKVLQHIVAYQTQQGIAHIDVVAANGARVETSGDAATLADVHVIWRSAPILVNNARVGDVWVAAPTDDLRRDALVLLIAFAALGSVLGGLMYLVPMRSAGRAQHEIEDLVQRIEHSQAALASLNENLEHQVDERSTELRRAYGELKEKEQNLREISTRAVKLQETERRGIARELHDSAGQALTAIRIHLQLMTDLLQSKVGDEKLTDLARRTTSMVDDTVEEIRRAVNQLGPAVLDDVGLEAAIRRAGDDLHETTSVEVQVNVELDAKLDASVESTCYRIVQESLTNVARHANASRVEISVVGRGDEVELVVRDDGKGFDPDTRKLESRGVIGMRERVELLGGDLRVDSAPGKGTTVSARLPNVEELSA